MSMAEPTEVQDSPIAKLDAAAAPSAPVPDEQLVKDKLNQLSTAEHSNKHSNNDDGDSDSEGEDGADQVNGTGPASGAAAKKKKKKKSKKKKGGAGAGGPAMQQTDPPSIGLSKIYPSGTYPVGEVSEYTGE